MSAEKKENEYRIPVHIAMIMDGNGRWAKKRHLPRTAGHIQGARAAEQACENASKLGVKYVTIYAFSTENWKRSEDEVSALMGIFRKYMVSSIEKCTRNNARMRVIGDKSRLDPDLQSKIRDLEEKTKNNTGCFIQVAINYGGRDELTRAVKKIGSQIKEGLLDPKDINEELINSNLDTEGVPYPDLLIRTSGEYRISNFLPWQIAYSEFYFTDTYWPDFDMDELKKAIDYYNGRERRFGDAK